MKKEENTMARIAELEETLRCVLIWVELIRIIQAKARADKCGPNAISFRLIQNDAAKAAEICKKAVRKG